MSHASPETLSGEEEAVCSPCFVDDLPHSPKRSPFKKPAAEETEAVFLAAAASCSNKETIRWAEWVREFYYSLSTYQRM